MRLALQPRPKVVKEQETVQPSLAESELGTAMYDVLSVFLTHYNYFFLGHLVHWLFSLHNILL